MSSRCTARSPHFTSGMVVALFVATVSSVGAQQPPQAQQPTAQDLAALQQRISTRLSALRREADRLATESRTLINDLRRLELERDVENEKAKAADAAALAAEAALQQGSQRLASLEAQRQEQLPDLQLRLVDLYKRGRGGYARLLAGAQNVRELARATRAMASLTRITQLRIDEHRRTLNSLRAEQEALRTKSAEVQQQRAAAQAARAAAERALRSRTALIADIDQRRDLTAQLVGELETASLRLQQQVSELASGRPAERVSIPLAAFRGALPWPAAGRLTGTFGQTTNRLGGSAVRNGVELSVTEGASVRAVHSGTVAYADAFTGFGTLVILEHGSNTFSLYGYLSAADVPQGQFVEAGTQLGRAGTAPAGPPAVYFEIRIDGRSVDPVQWLEPR